MTFSSLNRGKYLQEMSGSELDLLIIGGGITGAGIALDSVLRGMKTGLIEMKDFAFATSSRSTKLVHGGLRYLKQLELGLVAEVGKERAIVYENAPHVTTPEWMLLPIYKSGTLGTFSTSLGLKVYDFLAGVKRSERRYMLNKEETLQKEPLLNNQELLGSGIYVEYKTDDARLTVETLKKAVEMGALAANYAKAEDFIYHNGKIIGVKVRDGINGQVYSIYAKKIINAAGPWVDELREKDHSKKGKDLILTKGVHIIFNQKRFPLQHAIYFDYEDGRMIFAIPREDKTYLGTTDTVYKGDIGYPRMTEADRSYLLNAANGMFPRLKLTKEDIEGSWAGIRALVHEEGKAPSEISRKDEIFISPSGLISIAGGKLTGYRKMAERVVDLVSKSPSKTKNVPLSGGDVNGSEGFPLFMGKKIEEGIQLGLSAKEAEQLAHRYGSNVTYLFERIKTAGDKELKGLSKAVYASLLYGIEEELVVTPLDYFHRRTGALLFDRQWVMTWKEAVLQFMSQYFGWSDNQKKLYADELEKELIYSIKAN